MASSLNPSDHAQWYIYILSTFVLIVIVAVWSVTFAVDPAAEVRCGNFMSVKRVATECKRNAMHSRNGPGENITKEYVMRRLQKRCSEERVLYTACLRENLTHCSNAEDIITMEAEMNGVCTGNKIAGWITNYALRDFSTVNVDCLNVRPDIPQDMPLPEAPDSNTSVEQGIQMNINIVNTIYPFFRRASEKAITCSPWEDTFTVMLLETFSEPEDNLGMRLTDTVKLDIIELHTPTSGS